MHNRLRPKDKNQNKRRNDVEPVFRSEHADWLECAYREHLQRQSLHDADQQKFNFRGLLIKFFFHETNSLYRYCGIHLRIINWKIVSPREISTKSQGHMDHATLLQERVHNNAVSTALQLLNCPFSYSSL